jgi:hypothetical protein
MTFSFLIPPNLGGSGGNMISKRITSKRRKTQLEKKMTIVLVLLALLRVSLQL